MELEHISIAHSFLHWVLITTWVFLSTLISFSWTPHSFLYFEDPLTDRHTFLLSWTVLLVLLCTRCHPPPFTVAYVDTYTRTEQHLLKEWCVGLIRRTKENVGCIFSRESKPTETGTLEGLEDSVTRTVCQKEKGARGKRWTCAREVTESWLQGLRTPG